MFRKINLDALGVTASILCAIHCAILPLVLASLPILGINILHNPLFEYGMIGVAFAIGTIALRWGTAVAAFGRRVNRGGRLNPATRRDFPDGVTGSDRNLLPLQ
jgi:MerC mercury resistance protein